MKTLALLLATTSLTAFANSNAGSKVYISNTAIAVGTGLAALAALSYTEIGALGSHGQGGSSTNILNYDTWNMSVIQKSKGLTDAGSPEVEVARDATDPGQILVRAAALTNLNYAFKMVRNDAISPTGVGTTIYNVGIVTGPTRPYGRNEDFDLEVFTLGFNQLEQVVPPTAGGNPPVNTAIPTVTGTPKVATVLTVANGTWVGDATITYGYQWRLNGVPVAGATSSTYTPVTADIGKYATCTVTGTNASGSSQATSAPGAAIIP